MDDTNDTEETGHGCLKLRLYTSNTVILHTQK